MSSVDTLFKQASSNLKRKLNGPTTSFTRQPARKSSKYHETSSPGQIGRTNGGVSNGHKLATVEDEPVDDEQDDVEAGPAPPPVDSGDDDNNEAPEDDEEGRFYGGGVSKQEREVFDYIEENEEGGAEEKIDLAWLKKTALNFERKINKNAELRAKYEHDPLKFVSSEADLDAEIKNLSLISEHHELYGDFIKSGCVDSLVGLLAHDNTDIAISACEVIEELIDEDSETTEQEWNALVKRMLEADLVDLLVSNLHRLNQGNENDQNGVYRILSIMEDLLSDVASTDKLGNNERLLEWLLKRIETKDSSSNEIGQNRQYAAEIMVILAQNSVKAAVRLAKLGAVDILLQLLSVWRQKDPARDSEEEEFAENLFDCLISLVKERAGLDDFVKDEGVELCLIMLKDGKFSKRGALRVLDHAAGASDSVSVCEHMVEAGGLKTLFTTFMKSKKLERELVEHLIGILSSMLRQLPNGSAARIRMLAKFMEKDYEKCARLLELRREYVKRAAGVNKEIEAERAGLDEEEALTTEREWLSRRLDAGLLTLQTLDTILAWLIAEDNGARARITRDLESAGVGVQAVKGSLQEQLRGIEVEDNDAGAMSMRDMLQTLVDCL